MTDIDIQSLALCLSIIAIVISISNFIDTFTK